MGQSSTIALQTVEMRSSAVSGYLTQCRESSLRPSESPRSRQLMERMDGRRSQIAGNQSLCQDQQFL